MENKRLFKSSSLIDVHLRRTISNGAKKSQAPVKPSRATGQAIVELVIAFVIAALLFAGGFKIWAGLERSLISDATDYQAERVDAGSGTIEIPGQDIFPSEFEDVGDPFVNSLVDIQQCECISDSTKEDALALYSEKYELEEKISAYEITVEEEELTEQTLLDAWVQIPWCSQCCLCKIYCYTIPGDYSTRYDYWVTCTGAANNPCLSCRTCTWAIGGCGDLYCSGGDTLQPCRAMEVNPGHDHTEYREQIEEAMEDLEDELFDSQYELSKAQNQLARVESQIEDLDIACCGL